MYYVYILKTSRNTLYTGITSNLERRVEEHQSKSKKAAKYTRAFASVTLVYSEEVASREEALKREWQIKKMTRQDKDRLIHASLTTKASPQAS